MYNTSRKEVSHKEYKLLSVCCTHYSHIVLLCALLLLSKVKGWTMSWLEDIKNALASLSFSVICNSMKRALCNVNLTNSYAPSNLNRYSISQSSGFCVWCQNQCFIYEELSDQGKAWREQDESLVLAILICVFV